MSMENFEIDSSDTLDRECVVCGHMVQGDMFVRLNIEGEMVPACCPLCFETLQKDPARYAAQRLGAKAAQGRAQGAT